MTKSFTAVLRSKLGNRRLAQVALAAAVLTCGSIVALAQTAPPRPPASQPTAGTANEVVEKHEDGSFKLKYQVDAQGRKHGPYVQYYKGGKTHMRGGYTADQKSGLWRRRN